MDKLKDALAERTKLASKLKSTLNDENGGLRADLTEDDRAEVDLLTERIDALTEDIKRMEADQARWQRMQEIESQLDEPRGRRTPAHDIRPVEEPIERGIPATARKYGRLRNFTGENGDTEAFRFGTWFAGCTGAPWAVQRCERMAIPLRRAMGEGTNTAGGFLVPDQTEPRIIQLVEKYGVFRNYANIVPMAGDFISNPRRTGGLTAYFTDESETGTQSDASWDQVAMTAKKLMVLSKMSSELNEDSIINMGDYLAGEAARALAYKEDVCGFMGTGAATYGGIVGVGPSLTNLFGTTDDDDGVIVGTGDLPSELVLGDFNKVDALLPGYADSVLDPMAGPAWYCHRKVWSNMRRLEAAAGGTDGVQLINGFRVLTFLGYPVRLAQVMDTGTAISQVLAIFGDLAMAADMGIRRGITMAVSDSALNAFEKDELAVKWTERFDINVHDVGTTSSAGPVVALLGKAS